METYLKIINMKRVDRVATLNAMGKDELQSLARELGIGSRSMKGIRQAILKDGDEQDLMNTMR